jgi:hypothetical protein
MIALCREHHFQADHGAFTDSQLLSLKRNGRRNWEEVKGRFNWMRNRILVALGGNFFYETYSIFEFRGERIVWLERNHEGYLQLNLRMITISGEPRVTIRNNDWNARGNEQDIECPPSGKRLNINYLGGDRAKVEFTELNSCQDANKRYKGMQFENYPIEFPITAVEAAMKVGGYPLEFDESGIKNGGGLLKNNLSIRCGTGFAFNPLF